MENIKKYCGKSFLALVLLIISFQTSLLADNDFIYINKRSLEAVKNEINNFHYYFYNAYLDLIDAADDEISTSVNPVTNKTQIPPSGDKHDYLSLAPYWWPDPNTADGLPWIRKDGQVNPETRGNHTDQVRSSEMFSSVQTLALAYYFTKEERYAQKAYQHIHAWLIDEETLMNPNIKYGQAVPGSVDGRPAGIIEFVGVGNLITALQILERDSILSHDETLITKQWMSDMVNWLTTHEYAIKENESSNNHGNWYDYQVLGMYMYIGDTTKALAKAESIKSRRIAVQIEPDGSQPEELGRTKSVNYSTMNLWAMTRLCVMAEKLEVDLWNYETSNGSSIRRAYEFLVPYMMKEKTWTWEQIVGGGANASIDDKFPGLFAKASGIFQETLMPTSKSGSYDLGFVDKLCFPPLEMLKENDDLTVSFAKPTQDTTVSISSGLSDYVFDVAMANEELNDASLWMSVDGITLKTSAGKRRIWHGNTIYQEELKNLAAGTYELKVVAQTTEGLTAENYINLTVKPGSSSYTGSPALLPGTLEAEDYDLGGEGIAYHDSDNKNIIGAYRNDAVDIVQYGNLVAVTETEVDEWLHYTVNVTKSTYYDFEFTYYGLMSGSIGAQWGEADTVLFEGFALPVSSGPDFEKATKSLVYLAEGIHKLRINFESMGFHLDKMVIAESSTAALNDNVVNELKLYPNPTTGIVYLNKTCCWKTYDISGRLILSGNNREIDLTHQQEGVYLIITPEGTSKVLKHLE